MQKKYLYVALIVLVVGVLVYIFHNEKSQDNTIKIGSISALTGVGVFIGEEERNGALLAVEEINESGGIHGRKVELISEDVSLDKIKNAVTVAQKLINIDNVVAIVGPQWDEPAAPILPIIESAQVPMVGADNSDQLEKDISYKYFFSTWYDNRVGIQELLRYANANGLKNIAVIRPINAGFFKFTADILVNESKNFDINIVADLDLGNPLILDFKTPIAKIKQIGPDAVFIVTSDYNQCAFLKQASDLGLRIPSLGTESSEDGASLKNCPLLLENRFFSTPVVTNAQEAFFTKYEKRFGASPQYPSSVTAYDAVMVIATALGKTNLEGGEKLQKAIAETNIEGTALPRIKFNDKGFLDTPEDAFEMRSIKNGMFVRLNTKYETNELLPYSYRK